MIKKSLLLAVMFCLLTNTVHATPHYIEFHVSDDKSTLTKVYELDADASAAPIPKQSFELNGYSYTFIDLKREEIVGEEVYHASELVEFFSQTNDVNAIIARLDREMSVDYGDGFSGYIPLNPTTIRVTSLGTGTRSNNVTQTRTYPNLANADMSHIPKTLAYNGATLSLNNVQWQSDNTQNLDDYEITNRYSCIATYTGMTTSTYSKGYTVNAEYQGELRKEVVSMYRWTVLFGGEETKKPFKLGCWWLVGLIPLGVIPFIWKKPIKKSTKKERKIK